MTSTFKHRLLPLLLLLITPTPTTSSKSFRPGKLVEKFRSMRRGSGQNGISEAEGGGSVTNPTVSGVGSKSDPR